MKISRRSLFLLKLLGIIAGIGLFSALLPAQNPTGWGLREPTPAVVHPAILSPLQRVISLRGEWNFVLDPIRNGRRMAGYGGLPANFWDDALSIQVPGCWEAQGIGEPGMSQTWDCGWDHNPRPLGHIYMGSALYQKKIVIPADWKGQEIWLKVGGVRTEALFWVNGRPIGVINNFCGSYKFNVTEFVTPGEEAEIVASVRNDTPSRKGQMGDYHKFGGFYRDIELEATPQVWIDDVWVQGQIPQEGENDSPATARVHLTLGQTAEDASINSPVTALIRIQSAEGETLAVRQEKMTPRENPSEEYVVELPVKNARFWSPESPTLYRADVEITTASGERHGWTERFGFRRLEAKGDRFFLNGKPYFLRGYGETFIYPFTLISPPDREEHLKNMAFIKASGFNETRMHTHCEIPEYFEAADEAGILIQPELPYYQDTPTEGFDFDPLRDLTELYRHYRRYVSFAFYSMGNEGHLGSPLDRELYAWAKANDPDRLVQHQDGGLNTPENSDFTAKPYYVWNRGDYDDLTYPFISHEYLNLTVKLDPRLEPLFTGPMPSPVSTAAYEAELAACHLSRDMGDACIRAGHVLQAYYQKAGLEKARLDPACDGYNFWNFIDQMVAQAGAWTSQGYLNAFYQVKDGGLTPEEFAEFNSPTAVLCEFDAENNVLTSGETLAADLWISHFGADPLPAGQLAWTLQTTDGQTLLSGNEAFESFEIGDVRRAAAAKITMPNLEKPVEAVFRVQIDGTDIKNHWSVWIFPKRPIKPSLKSAAVAPEWADWFRERFSDVRVYGGPDVLPTDILIAPWESESYREGIAEGRNILAIRPSEGKPNVSLGWWSFGNQLGTAFAKDPVFGDFPHSGSLNPLWFRLVKDDPLRLSEETGNYEPLAVGTLCDGYALYLGRRRVENTQVTAVFGLDLLQDAPEALFLLETLIQNASQDHR